MPKVKIVYDRDSNSSGTIGSKTNMGGSGGGRRNSKTTGKFAPKLSGPRTVQPKGRRSSKKFDDYLNLRTELTNDGNLWQDPDFLADDSSLFPKGSKSFKNIEWKRPSDLCDSPHLFTDGMSRFDIQQGEIGDCWFLAAVASLSMSNDLIEKVVPSDQGFDKRRYCGAFFFRFWRFGDWEEVIVDDRLPTRNGRLVFMHSKENNEFWSALLEKAYAKINGSYENLAGGSQAEAMEDFTGGLCETFDLTKNPPNLFKMMLKGHQRNSLMGCSIEAPDMSIEGRLGNGLIVGHAYSITDVRMVNAHGKDNGLIRIRNPWGQSEWNGAWSDDSKELKDLTAQQKADMGLVNDDDGEFWMCVEDFAKSYTKLEICHLSPEDEDECDDDDLTTKRSAPKQSAKKWEECLEVGNWIINASAGGCRNYLGSFGSNPQFRVEVVDPDEDDDEDLGTLIVGLMQKDVRRRGLEFNTIGYSVYRLKDPRVGRLDASFFKYNKMAAKSPQFINTREICGRHKLEPGTYVIIPSTFKPGEEGEFLMRIFSEKPNTSKEIDDNNSFEPTADITKQATQAMTAASLAKLKDTFKKFAGPSEQVNAYQLQAILNATIKKEMNNFEGFHLEICRSLVALYDVDQTGKVEFDEFTRLWGDLRTWKNIFKQFDADASGTMDAYEFRNLLENTGFRLNNRVFEIIAMRYADPKKGTLAFDDVLLAVIRLRTAFENFDSRLKNANGEAMFNVGTFLQMSMYC